MFGAAVVAAPAAEHRLRRSKAKRAIKNFVRDVARDVDGSLTDDGDLLLVDGHDHVPMAEPTPPPTPESLPQAARVAAALDYLAQRDDDDLEDLLFDSVRRCWPNWSHGQ
jgi:hypothetical protein